MPAPAPSRFALAVAVAKIILRTRRFRRNLMFILTISMMVFVFLGAYPLAGFLASYPWIFVFYWGFTFLLVVTVILLALYDMMRISREESTDLEKMRKDLESIESKDDDR